MARKPEDVKTQGGTTPENPAVDDVHIKREQEVEAATDAGQAVLAHEKAHPKVHKSRDEEPVPDTSGQPIVEDEP